MRMAITLATRGRPQQLLSTISRSMAHWTDKGTVLWVMADHDDEPTVDAINSAIKGQFGEHVRLSVKQREDTIAEKWNRIIELDPDADVYFTAADDDPYLTPGYDTLALEAAKRLPDGIGMVYGHNANASFSSVVAPTAGLARKMGYVFPPYFPYWFVDHWTDDIARIIGRISFADIRTDQSNAGKTQELREPAWWATFFDCAYLHRRAQAHAIIRAEDFASPPWLKELLLAHHPTIEFRSRWINDHVRANARQLEGWSAQTLKEERYQRIRQKAVAMVPHLLDDYNMPEREREAFRAYLLPPTTIRNLKVA